ncbi:ribonuclease inhibitor-like [Sardina pilchardus]|uniref:ribonuclease inhibitor-like n=1 Tax=Sardina pilchardus TaxID=27697 RepID=UPI002E14C0B8
MLNPSCVKELDMGINHPGESAQKLLSATLEDPHRKVESFQFADYKLTFKSCEIVAAVLQSPNSLLQLDLSNNDLGDSGVELLSKGLSSSNCILQTLRGEQVKQVVDRVGNILEDASCPGNAAVVGKILQRRQGAAYDLLGCAYNPLHSPPFCRCSS